MWQILNKIIQYSLLIGACVFGFVLLNINLFYPQDCQTSVNRILDVRYQFEQKKDIEIYPSRETWQLRTEIWLGGPRKSNWADVNRMLRALPGLKMQYGYELDYVLWRYRPPYIYAKKHHEIRFTSIDELYSYKDHYFNQFSEIEYDEKNYNKVVRDFYRGFMNNIHIDGTDEAYVQFVIFYIMGNQFYSYGRHGENDGRIICDFDGLAERLGESSIRRMTAEQLDGILSQAKKIDLSPQVLRQENLITVKTYLFASYGGLIKMEMDILRDFPHEIVDVRYEQIIPYGR